MPNAFGYLLQRLNESSEDFSAAKREMEAFLSTAVGFTFTGVFTDDAECGNLPLSDRPGGKALWSRITWGDTILFDLDRAFRSARDAWQTVCNWRMLDIQTYFWGRTEPIDDAILIDILGIAAGWEKEKETARLRRAFATRRTRGKLLNGSAPPGYKIVGRKGQRRLVPDHNEQAAVEKIIQLTREGYSWWDTRQALIDLGIKDRRGKYWTIHRISKALKDATRQPALQA